MRIAKGVTIAVATCVRTNQNKKMNGGASRRHSSSWVTLGDSYILQKKLVYKDIFTEYLYRLFKKVFDMWLPNRDR
jgi:hypothetical protein